MMYLGLRNRYIADIQYTQRNVLINHVKYHGVFESNVTFFRGICMDITRKYHEFFVKHGDRT